jgi:FkbM family methyltransferase
MFGATEVDEGKTAMSLRALTARYLPTPLVDTLKAAKYNIERWTFPRHVVSHRYGPFEFSLNIHDRVAKEWYDKRWELPPEIDFLSRGALASGALVFDLGAHQCLIAMMLAKFAGSGGKVIAVEANSHNAAVAALNIRTNGVPNVEIVHALISDKTGMDFAALSFNSSKASADGDGHDGELVESLTVDDLSHAFGWPQVVYMDIEGFEIGALNGASRTLAHGCTWFIELHGDEQLSRYGAKNDDVLRFFPHADFTAHLCLSAGSGFQLLSDRRTLPAERCFVTFVPRHVVAAQSDIGGESLESPQGRSAMNS